MAGKLTLVVVEWRDATADDESWRDIKEVEAHGLDIVTSAGLLVNEDEHVLRIVLDRAADLVHSLGVIPKANIVRRRNLSVATLLKGRDANGSKGGSK